MMGLVRFLGLLLALWVLPTRADDLFGYGDLGTTPAHPLSWEQIADAVSDNRQPLRSVEDLLAWIARTHPEFFDHFTLMRESHSTQGASAKDPRAIVFQRDGRLVLTFNGDTKQDGYQRVELMQFREPHPGSPLGTAFEFREIAFHEGKAELSEPNPNRCRQCHQAELRPIWPPYEIWPGSYGKYDDALPDYEHDKYAFTGGQSDAQIREETGALHDYQKFSPGWRTHARYRFLKFAAGSPVAPFNPERRGKDEFRPNLHLTHLIGQLHARQVAGQLAANRQCFEAYSPLLMAALLDCEAAALEAPLTQAGSLLRAKFPGAEKAGGLYRYDVADRVPDLLALMGMEKEQWNPDENPAVWHYYVGVADIAGLVADALYPVAKQTSWPAFSVAKDYLRPAVYGSDDDSEHYEDYNPDAPPPPPSPRERVCDVLQAQVSKLHPDPQVCAGAKISAPVVVGMCLSCHDGQTKGAPKIALAEPRTLSADWRQRIVDRISRADGRAMPPTRHLTLGERQALVEYLGAR